MKIGNFNLKKNRTLIIAEIGGNHEGNFDVARAMIRAAARSGADAAKFQILKAEKIVNKKSSLAAYSGASHEKQWFRFKKMQFSLKQYRELERVCKKEKILFLASVFDVESLKNVDALLPAYKVASGDMTFTRLLDAMKKNNKPLLVSTGAATMREITWLTQYVDRTRLVLMHCVCAYPAPDEELNLLTIPFLAKKFKVPVGYSDHSLGLDACLAAVSLGACVLEKHFTLNPANKIGDHKHSMTPAMLSLLAHSVRRIEKMCGGVRDNYFSCEERARKLVRRGLYASRNLSARTRLKKNDFLALRPLEGIPAEKEILVIGKKINKDIKKGEPLEAVESLNV